MKMVFKSWEVADILREFVNREYQIPAEAISNEVKFVLSNGKMADPHFDEAIIEVATDDGRPRQGVPPKVDAPSQGPYR